MEISSSIGALFVENAEQCSKFNVQNNGISILLLGNLIEIL